MIDFALEHRSSSKDFKRVFEIYKDINDYEAEKPEEFFAECFAKYYFSDISRKEFEREFPEAHQYFTDLEETLLHSSFWKEYSKSE